MTHYELERLIQALEAVMFTAMAVFGIMGLLWTMTSSS